MEAHDSRGRFANVGHRVVYFSGNLVYRALKSKWYTSDCEIYR